MFISKAVSSASCRRLLHVPVSRPCTLVTQSPVTAILPAMGRRGMADMPVPQSASALPFAGAEASANEGWETTVAWWYGSTALFLGAMFVCSPANDIETWAQQEAAARLQLKAADPSFVPQFGQHYQYVHHV
jgi:hypothetical protein